MDRDAFGFDEARALSYGALYHPWLQADLGRAQRDPATELLLGSGRRGPRVVPPDGAALGVLAGRASRRGAWIAPANEPLKDVVALAPPVAATDWQVLQDAQVNLLRADPRGLLALSADTLALDAESELRPINVRRLLTLLRRLALRRGTSYVFEPNGPTLRRAVQRSFDELLGDLFRRGAFAGATPAQSFRVVTDATLNDSRDADAGRFFVELRVAPALPMRFLAVRLAQSGDRLTVAEEL
jgi:phage tail sheath protein FI